VAALRKKYHLAAWPPETGRKRTPATEQLTMAWAPKA